MCKVNMLRAFLNQRLSVAIEEIVVVFERTITEYEEELCRAKEENVRQRQLLDSLFVPQYTLQRTEVSEEKFYPEQHKPEPPRIKEEEQEDDITNLPVTVVPVKSEGDADKSQSEEKHCVEPQSGSSSQHSTKQHDENCFGGLRAESYLAPLSDTDDVTPHSADSDEEDNSRGDPTYHVGNKHWKCSQCDKTFGVKMNLKRHMIIHTGEKPFACSVCGKRFTQKAHLTSHFRTHTGEKPFACSYCGKRFSRSECLITHTRTHTGEKPFRCNVCDQRFSYKYKIKKHKCVGERSGANATAFRSVFTCSYQNDK
ncbi:zinc finger protein 22-like [Corythoichthys intestinalis]|uniref:zinc finger protein 22-like n=1 Tax=Corythoichthys intestinalis TaxID=161448 RepID=UPI0025A53076|nr:zinc finger protein 22-like [Corythoichthys intestinalis]